MLFRLLLLLAVAVPSAAGQTAAPSATACQVEDPRSLLIRGVSWNAETGQARVTVFSGRQIKGRVTAARDHDGGRKVNVEVSGEGEEFLGDVTELVVFPALGGYRLIGVEYAVEDGERLTSSIIGSFEVSCVPSSVPSRD